MSVRDLIAAAFNKDAAAFEETLQLVMQEKMGEAIQARFSPVVYEEEVDLEEAKSDEDDEDEDEDEDDMCEEAELAEALDHNVKIASASSSRFDPDKTITKLHHSDGKIISSLRVGADDHVKKHLAGAYRDDNAIVHNKTGRTMATIKPGMTMGELHQKVHNYIKVNHPEKKRATVEHPSDTRSIVSASDEHAAALKKQFHNKDTNVRIMKRKEGNKVYLDSKNAEIHKNIVGKLNSMHEEVDQIDEISDAMKSRYVSAAKKDLTAKFTKPLAPEHKTATGKAKKSWLNSPERAELNRKMGQRADIVKKLTKEEVEQIDEISGAKIGTYLIKARKSEAELDKKRDASYDDEDTPENKIYRKKLTTAMNKRRWGQGKAMDKLTGNSFAKVPATEK